MIEPIPFDPHRFTGAAPGYLTAQPAYAAGLMPRIAAACGLDGRGVALDLGCGPGILAIALAPYVAEVLAIDPDPGMLAAGRAAAAGLPIRFAAGASHDLDPALGPFRIVTIGRAFHWMDRVATAALLHRMVEPGGAVVLTRTDHLDGPDNAWRGTVQAVLDIHGVGRTRAIWRQPGWVPHEAVLLESPFCKLERIGVIERLRTPAATLLTRALSMGASTQARLGPDGLARLTGGIQAALEHAAEAGMVIEVVESSALIARRA